MNIGSPLAQLIASNRAAAAAHDRAYMTSRAADTVTALNAVAMPHIARRRGPAPERGIRQPVRGGTSVSQVVTRAAAGA